MANERASPSFLRELKWAMLHLYDPAELRQSPLIELFGVGEREDPASALRGILSHAIASLRPGAGVPAQSNAWRIYNLLLRRYAEQFSQRQVAADLALSIRQLRRQENLALAILADYLWVHYDLKRKAFPTTPGRPAAYSPAPTDDDTASSPAMPSREQELAWLKRSLRNESTGLNKILQATGTIVAPLARALQVRIEWDLPENLPDLVAPIAPLRQALLNVLTVAIPCATGGTLLIRAELDRWRVCVVITPSPRRSAAHSPSPDYRENLEMARQLVGLAGGTLAVTAVDGRDALFRATLTLPSVGQVPVLIVDDNVDTLRLLERYLTGSRYRFVGVQDPGEVLALAAQTAPEIILLDVMLPGIDGWELLGQLREHPHTRGVPIVVCTILPQEELAMTLGAAAFLRKPVSRSLLLAALDHQFALRSRESC